MSYSVSYACISNIGKLRSINQDNFICDGIFADAGCADKSSPLAGSASVKNPVIFGIFDGMGGEQCGEIASYIAAKEAGEFSFMQDSVCALNEFCLKANRSICDYAQENLVSSMGTTAAMVLFSKKIITICNIGDSRIFRFSKGELNQISKDHVVMAQFGIKPPLSQNLGIPESVMIIEPYLSQGRYRNGDKYLICSDGLTDMLSENEISDIISKGNVLESAESLVDMSLSKGGKDNITVILLEIKSSISRLLFKDKSNGGNGL